MAKVIKTAQVNFQGFKSVIYAGTEYPDTAEIVVAYPKLFVLDGKKAPVAKPAKKEELKEILLVEEPAAALEVTVVEEPIEMTDDVKIEVEEVKPERKTRKRK